MEGELATFEALGEMWLAGDKEGVGMEGLVWDWETNGGESKGDIGDGEVETESKVGCKGE